MKTLNDIKFPIVLLFISATISSLVLPFFPLDETRYLSVAWEMRQAHSIVPLLNGAPYAHKPPLLFFLINLDWLLFGVNERSLRFLPFLFSLLNLVMTYKLALLLWRDRRVARLAATLLASTFIYLLWSNLIMFDLLLTFWVLLGVYGFLLGASGPGRPLPALLIGLSIGGGLLSKGPVIFVHLLPIGLLYPLWRSGEKKDGKRWYVMLSLSLLLGLAIAALWAIPAAIRGGEAYRHAILWGQTAGRVTSSFSHRHPLWWYLPMLPALFFPWFLLRPAWHGLAAVKKEDTHRFLLIWFAGSLAIFSVISCKQIYYLIPMLPAAVLLAAKNIAAFGEKNQLGPEAHRPLAIFYLLAGILFLSLVPFLKSLTITTVELLPALVFIVLGGVILCLKPSTTERLIQGTALSSLLVFITIALAASDRFSTHYDAHDLARFIKAKQDAGYTILHRGKYHGQYQFIGRLTQPLVVLRDKRKVHEYVQAHDKTLLLVYKKPGETLDGATPVYQHPFRRKTAFILERKDAHIAVPIPDSG